MKCRDENCGEEGERGVFKRINNPSHHKCANESRLPIEAAASQYSWRACMIPTFSAGRQNGNYIVRSVRLSPSDEIAGKYLRILRNLAKCCGKRASKNQCVLASWYVSLQLFNSIIASLTDHFTAYQNFRICMAMSSFASASSNNMLSAARSILALNIISLIKICCYPKRRRIVMIVARHYMA